ncbi:MAG: hypothetical protein JW759_09435 [Candidatus Coatesbacteria bacterium]|nr:hypothetical protein [Candidatus Coatesbacteria bacterium]
MKRLLLVAIALVAAASIAFAVCTLTSSTTAATPSAAQVEQDASRGASTLAMDDCIWYVGILSCVPTPAGTCHVTFRVNHWDKGQDCCAHDAGDLWFSIGGIAYTKMTVSGSGHDNVTGCDFHTCDSAQYELSNNATALYWVYDDADSEHCQTSGGLYIQCQ